ncbi:site-2 protease family protein [Terriglobus aquaticus]|uniref:Site-2 protease family protein n=1 Tax=Terriglobus aquaticus TaxID=940139 RepID=A0ABW9KJ40_9BACT|nr:site-2 protease family protein [Terriglobus aquaticus]
MSQSAILLVFEFVALIFAFSIHEAAHAWMASRCGDQTARMLGRVTLNPVRHLDPLGSVLLPLIAAFTHLPLIGWAKPTPVVGRNLRNYKRDDILVTLAGPGVNLLVALVALLMMVVVKHFIPGGAEAVGASVTLALFGGEDRPSGLLFPLVLLLFCSMLVNLGLAVFNVIPIPPLDGSRVLRHFLPYHWQENYDRIGGYSLLLLMLVGGRLMSVLFTPVLGTFLSMLISM